jgi:hypothetical protein
MPPSHTLLVEPLKPLFLVLIVAEEEHLRRLKRELLTPSLAEFFAWTDLSVFE